MLRSLGLLGVLALAFIVPASAQAPAGRVPVQMYIGDDTFRSADISPNGRYVLAIHRETIGDVLTVLDLQTNHIARVSVAREDQQMKISGASFKSDDRIIFRLRQRVHVVGDRVGLDRTAHVDDAWEWDSRVYSANLDGSDLKALYDPSSQQGLPRWVTAGIIDTLESDPNHVLMIAPGAGGAALWKVDVHTAEHTIVETGDFRTVGWVTDSQGTPVLRQEVVANGRGFAWQRRGPGQRGWTEIVRFVGVDSANSAPTFEGLGPATNPGQVFVLARREGENTGGLYVYDTATGQYTETLATNPNFDVSNAIRDGRANRILGACWIAHRVECSGIDPAFTRRWNAVTHALGQNVNVTLAGFGGPDNSRWLIHTFGPQDLGTYYLYDANARSMNALFGSRGDVDPAMLPTERVVQYTASDGMQLWGYLWIPPGVTNATHLPLVVVPHGGPESRDIYGTDAFSPWLASQGYAVFQPNFRGGGGSGRQFVEAGWRQFGMRMQDDMTDGVHYLVQQGIADPARMCIMGWSYGGYVAMTASFQNTDLFKCSVAGAGISDMNEMLRWTRDGDARDNDVDAGGRAGGSSSVYRYWSTAMGTDSAVLNAHSAAENANRITIPLLLIHGDEDSVVPYDQSLILQRAMQRAGHPVRLITLEGSNHTPDRDDQFQTVLTESVAFIGQNIGPGVAPGSQ